MSDNFDLDFDDVLDNIIDEDNPSKTINTKDNISFSKDNKFDEFDDGGFNEFENNSNPSFDLSITKIKSPNI